MGTMVYSLLWVMQDLYHQQYGWFWGGGVPFRVLFTRVPQSIGDLKKGPNLGN